MRVGHKGHVISLAKFISDSVQFVKQGPNKDGWGVRVAATVRHIKAVMTLIFGENIFCSDFRYESNGIFELGVVFFFFRQISTF